MTDQQENVEALAAELRAAAEKTTPGPWETRGPTRVYGNLQGDQNSTADLVATTVARNAATFIALANPANILTLLTAFAAEREENERLRMEIMGGEDVPGLAASLPLQTILDIQADNVAVSRSSFERLLTAQAQITALVVALRDGLGATADAAIFAGHTDPKRAAAAKADLYTWRERARLEIEAALSKALLNTGEQSQ